MTETTHTLLDDAANLLESHGCKGHSRVRAAKGVIPNVPLSARSESGLIPGLKAALEIAEKYIPTVEVQFLRNDIKDAILKNAAPQESVRGASPARPADAAPSAVSPTWQDCTRCGAAILNEHPNAAPQGRSGGDAIATPPSGVTPAVAAEPEKIGNTPTTPSGSADSSGKPGTEARQFVRSAARLIGEECLGKPARYWYDAFHIAEGLRADAERRVAELKSAQSSAERTSVLPPAGETAALPESDEDAKRFIDGLLCHPVDTVTLADVHRLIWLAAAQQGRLAESATRDTVTMNRDLALAMRHYVQLKRDKQDAMGLDHGATDLLLSRIDAAISATDSCTTTQKEQS